MSGKRLTAVDWLYSAMLPLALELESGLITFGEFTSKCKEYKKQAKALEREQQKEIAIDCFNAGYREGEHDSGNGSKGDISKFANANIYYQQNYGSKSDYFTKTYGDEKEG